MVARIAPAPVSVSTQSFSDFRSRHVTGERALLQDSTPTATRSQDSGDKEFTEQQPRPPAEPAPVTPPGGMFAAAVIAGALSPRPRSIEEVYTRIGSAWIPPESELKLRDLSV